MQPEINTSANPNERPIDNAATTPVGPDSAADKLANVTSEADEPAVENADETFSRSYVEKLRDENAKLRVRAQDSDELRHRLHRALVEQTGKLADAADLEYADDHLADPDALSIAIDELLAARPHLRSRTPKGSAAQGYRGSGEEPASLLNILKQFS